MDINVEFLSAECKVMNWLQDLRAYKIEETQVTACPILKEKAIETDHSKKLDENKNSSCSEKSKNETEYRRTVYESSSNSNYSVPFVPIWGRTPYINSERILIINYIVEHDLFLQIKGNIVWQKMESLRICSRSWQSMKSQFMKYIWPHIDDFHLPDSVKKKFSDALKLTGKREPGFMLPHQRGWREKVNYYTFAEDVKILKYILFKKRYKWTHGNLVWIEMCDNNILPGRSWQSLKSRFFTILPYLSRYKLEQFQTCKLLTRSGSKTHKRVLSHKNSKGSPYFKDGKEMFNCQELNSTCSSKNFCLTEYKVSIKDKQNIRKRAIETALSLAANLKNKETFKSACKKSAVNERQPDVCNMFGKKEENCQNSVKELVLDVKEHSFDMIHSSCNSNNLLKLAASSFSTVVNSIGEMAPISGVKSTVDNSSFSAVKSVPTLVNDIIEECLFESVDENTKSNGGATSRNCSNDESKMSDIILGCESRTEQEKDCNIQIHDEEETDVENCLEDYIVLNWESEDNENQ